MDQQKIDFILKEFLQIELDDDVCIKDLINEDNIPNVIESIHMILESLQKL
jgi:hypothetical protein